jgi:hypothetical protein
MNVFLMIDEDDKVLGVFSSYQKAKDARSQFSGDWDDLSDRLPDMDGCGRKVEDHDGPYAIYVYPYELDAVDEADLYPICPASRYHRMVGGP